jgi:hypothetical protein
MNKENVLKWTTLVGKVLTLASGLAIYADKLPAEWAPVLVIVFGAFSILKDLVNRIGDLVDDGKLNQSFK